MNQHSIFTRLYQRKGAGNNPAYMSGEYYGKREELDPLWKH
ncbi:hypothetical protein ACYVVU_08715 [Arenicellales bacterium IMCC55707]